MRGASCDPLIHTTSPLITRVIAGIAGEVGHSVAFCAAGNLEQTLRRRGYRVYSTPETTMLGLPKLLSRLLERRSPRATPF